VIDSPGIHSYLTLCDSQNYHCCGIDEEARSCCNGNKTGNGSSVTGGKFLISGSLQLPDPSLSSATPSTSQNVTSNSPTSSPTSSPVADNTMKIGIGLGVGLGVPLLLVLLAMMWLLLRQPNSRTRTEPQQKVETDGNHRPGP
jgi:hypothetical protein